MVLASLAIIVGLVLLIWSADKFVDGAAATARYYNIPPLLIGMIIIGFGTSAPEIVVSVLAAAQGDPGIALGNAYGSNISNIALILGVTALISPVIIKAQVVRKELPVLLGVSILSAYLLLDGELSRLDGIVLLVVFALFMAWSIYLALKNPEAAPVNDLDIPAASDSSIKMDIVWLIVGLIVLVVSSRLLVWGAVSVAQQLGVSNLIIGLTVVAIGTSLPELASSVIATKKGNHDMAIGNVIGSNLFNTLIVVGLAGSIHPMVVEASVLTRDVSIMIGLTLLILVMGLRFGRSEGRINGWQGAGLVLAYIGYIGYLVALAF